MGGYHVITSVLGTVWQLSGQSPAPGRLWSSIQNVRRGPFHWNQTGCHKVLTESKANSRALWLLWGHNAVNNSMLKQPGVQVIASCVGAEMTPLQLVNHITGRNQRTCFKRARLPAQNSLSAPCRPLSSKFSVKPRAPHLAHTRSLVGSIKCLRTR